MQVKNKKQLIFNKGNIMTKYAKIMATFGVLAGLGVASLPLATLSLIHI